MSPTLEERLTLLERRVNHQAELLQLVQMQAEMALDRYTSITREQKRLAEAASNEWRSADGGALTNIHAKLDRLIGLTDGRD